MVSEWFWINTADKEDFASCFRREIETHPHMEPMDALKFIYQAAYGCEHFVEDYAACRQRMVREFEEAEAQGLPLIEPLSADWVRVNIAACREKGIEMAWLLEMFLAETEPPSEKERARRKAVGEARMTRYLDIARSIVDETGCFSMEAWEGMLKSYGGGPVSHSDTYRAHYAPHYRVLGAEFALLAPILIWAAARGEQGGIIAIEGRCASGKSTIASRLNQALGCNLVHMDDFFLPRQLRTEARLSEVGGNIDYDRFIRQVLPRIREGNFAYGIYDCSKGTMRSSRLVGNSPFTVVEGSYSRHPKFGEYADLSVFVTVDREQQLQRIIKRNGMEMAKQFASRWIPMEEHYFQWIGALYDLKEIAK